MTIYRRPYIESAVFIAFIKGELRDDGKHDCKQIMDSILKVAVRGRFQVYTSSLTIAEVFKKKNINSLTIQENEDLRPYFREPYIQLIEVDRAISERANELCRVAPQETPLRPNDAVHIACAERAECETLLTYDKGMINHGHPTIAIEWPQQQSIEPETVRLFPEMEQAPLLLSADNEKGA